jgi:hypothetical protein
VAKKKGDAGSQGITWESVRLELNCTRTEQGQIDYDRVRRGKLTALAAHTKRKRSANHRGPQCVAGEEDCRVASARTNRWRGGYPVEYG